MALYSIQGETLSEIADAIREQTGTEEPIQTKEMSSMIRKIEGGSPNAVLYTEQILTDEQKAQARENIGATSADDIPTVPTELPNPYSLTINGKPSYDGSREMDIELDAQDVGALSADGGNVGLINIINANGTDDSHIEISNYSINFYTDKTDTNGVNISTYNGEYIEILNSESDAPVRISGVATPIYDHNAANKKYVDTSIDLKLRSVTTYGAKGDGSTDDTAAFQTALSENRVVFVPGGTYILSDTLVIAENCCLELSQDTILKFTQTEADGIEMRGSATLRGNHAILSVPYGFTGSVIACDTAHDGSNHASIPPYAKADPMIKRQRFIYDVNIVKANASGFYRTMDGVCDGTGIYLSASGTSSINWLWALTLSGIRIAGGFQYGIRAANFDDPSKVADNAWNHDMRIEAVIEACEIGVSLENCNGAHLQVTVQPCVATNGTAYAKHGVYLNDARFVDMMGSRIWDWNENTSLWTEGGQYQHLAMIGNCRGLLLDDFMCHESGYDIRDLIYTDTSSNFDTMTILQEPGNKWFKSIDNVPYFNDGTANRKLMLNSDKFSAEQTDFIHPADGYYTYTPKFTNLVSAYDDGKALDANGGLLALAGYVTTDFIPIDGGKIHTYRIGGDGITWNDSYGYCRIAWYDSNKTLKGSVMAWSKIGSNEYYPTVVDDDTVAAAFATNANVAPPDGAAYFKVTAAGSGANLIVTVDEAQDYTAVWHGEPRKLDDSIHAKNDWNAAEGEVGYIENRTHYLGRGTVIVPEQMVEVLESSIAIPVSIYTESEYLFVNFDGTEYICKKQNFDGIPLYGNPLLFGVTHDSGEPFAFVTDGTSEEDYLMLCLTTVEDGTSVKFSVQEATLVKLPEIYLPDTVKTHTITVTAEQWESRTDGALAILLPMGAPDTALIEMLKSGVKVRVDLTEAKGGEAGAGLYMRDILGYETNVDYSICGLYFFDSKLVMMTYTA